MAGSLTSTRDPYEGWITKDILQWQWTNGNGSPLNIDRNWFMTSGPGTSVDFLSSSALSGLFSQNVGTTIDLSAIPMTKGLDANEFTHNFYGMLGYNTTEGHALGEQTFRTLGNVKVLPGGKYLVDIEIRPYDSPFDFNNNGAGFFTELFRSLGSSAYGKGTPFDIQFRGPMGGRHIKGIYTEQELRALVGVVQCFPANTLIQTSLTSTAAISDLQIGTVVLAFDPIANLGRGALVPRRVTRLFRNSTTEWIKLTWVDAASGEAKELVATPGHNMLDKFGRFTRLDALVKGNSCEIILSSGDCIMAQAELLVYTSATADMFERATAMAATSGALAILPHALDAWATYNFEVEDLHTYVAGGVRVHNDSLYAPVSDFGKLADNVSGLISDFAFGHNTLASVFAGSALRSVTSTAADALVGPTNFDAAHLTGRYISNVAGGLGALGGSLLMQDLISGLGIRGPAAAALTQFGSGVGSLLAQTAALNLIMAADPSGSFGVGAGRQLSDNLMPFHGSLGQALGGQVFSALGSFAGNELAGLLGLNPTLAPLVAAPIQAGISQVGANILGVLGGSLPAGSSLLAGVASSMGNAFIGAIGSVAGTLVDQALGLTSPGAQLGSQIGSAIGGFIGTAIGGPLAPILGTIGSFIGSIIGGFIGSLFGPIMLDLDGSGIKINELDRSNIFMDDGGLSHRTAWAGAGSAVLFFDPNNTGAITLKNQFVFTEWDPTATSDMQALRNVFDSNGDGKFDASDAKWSLFKVMRTNADGTTTALTLAQAGVTSINLKVDTSNLSYSDGSNINGETTFTKVDGSTGTVASVSLAADSNGYAVKTVTAVVGTTTTMTTTGTNSDGSVAFINVQTTVISGTSSTRTITYDNNGDGVIDSRQVITKSVDVAGVTTELLINYNGGGVKLSAVQTVTSADGLSITISRDTNGGGWYSQVEQRTFANYGAGIVLSDVNVADQDAYGTVFSWVDTSFNGLNKRVSTSFTGISLADRVVTDQLVNAVDGSRTEIEITKSRNGTVLSKVRTDTSADGKKTTVTTDNSGFGVGDIRNVTTIVANPNGTSTSTINTYGQLGAYISGSTVIKSADGLSSTTTDDMNGDNFVDRKTIDTTVINADKSRDHTVDVSAQNGTLLSHRTTHLDFDQVTKQVYVDSDGDGHSDYVELTYKDAANANRIVTGRYHYGNNGSLINASSTYTSADGLTVDSYVSHTSNLNIWESQTHDVTVKNVDGSSTETVYNYGPQSATLISKRVTDINPNGLNVTTKFDNNGDGTFDYSHNDLREVFADLSTRHTVSDFNGTGTLHNQQITNSTMDRRTVNITMDDNGDGHIDKTESYIKSSDGLITDTVTNLATNGTVTNKHQTITTSNGLSITTNTDSDGNGTWDTINTDVTSYNVDGSMTRTLEVHSNTSLLVAREVATTSGNGLNTTTQSDLNGDGTFDKITTENTILKSDGSTTSTTAHRDRTNKITDQATQTTSANGLSTTTQMDINGDGKVDFTQIDTNIYNADGSVTRLRYTNNPGGSRRETITNYTWADPRNTDTYTDSNGDGINNVWDYERYNADGSTATAHYNFNINGSVQNAIYRYVDSNGLTSSTYNDYNGDGNWDGYQYATRVYNSNGSLTETMQDHTYRAGFSDVVTSTTSVTTSGNGLSITTTADSDGNGTIDTTKADITQLAQDGTRTETITNTNYNTSTRDKIVTILSADQLTKTVNFDVDGNTTLDETDVSQTGMDGKVTRTITNYKSDGITKLSKFITVSAANGTNTVWSDDRNGDGIDDLVTTTTIVLLATGGTQTTIVDSKPSGASSISLDKVVETVNGNGLSTTIQEDRNGDSIYDLTTTKNVYYFSDGSRYDVINVMDLSSSTIPRDRYYRTESANGLNSDTTLYLGNSIFSLLDDQITGYADSSLTETMTYRLTTNAKRESLTATTSADHLTKTVTEDINGDNFIDRKSTYKDLGDGNSYAQFSDFYTYGGYGQTIALKVAANGMSKSATIGVNSGTFSDISRTEVVTYSNTGQTIDTLKVTAGTVNPHTFSTQTTTTEANGYLSNTTLGFFGNAIDETKKSQRTINADGSEKLEITTKNAAGTLVQHELTVTDANGLHLKSNIDYNGDGVDDRVVESFTYVDSSKTLFNTEYAAGIQSSQQVTKVSADGLIVIKTYITGSNTVTSTETTTYATNSMGSYAWVSSDGATSTHVYDAVGIDTWTVVSGGITTTSMLDKASVAEFEAIAKRIFDTTLDREMYDSERETLGKYVVNGGLNKLQLITDILASNEFTTKYAGGNVSGTSVQSQLNLIDQFYLNAFDRDPTALEILAAKTALSSGNMSLPELVAKLSESSEHLFMGTDHIETNNTVLNIGGLTRTHNIDYVYNSVSANIFVKELYDTLYDRDPTIAELAFYTNQILAAATAKWDVAKAILTNGSNEFVTKYGNLTGVALVNQLYLNSFGYTPPQNGLLSLTTFGLPNPTNQTLLEQSQWASLLTSGSIDLASFATALATSIDHGEIGLGHNVLRVTTDGQTVSAAGGTISIADNLWLVGTTVSSANTTINLGYGSNVTVTAIGDVTNVIGGNSRVTGNGQYVNVGTAVSASLSGVNETVELGLNSSLSLVSGSIIGGYAQWGSLNLSANTSAVLGGTNNTVKISGVNVSFTDSDLSHSNMVSFVASTSAVSINLATGVNSGGFAQGSHLTGVYNITGTNYDDVLIGDAHDNILQGYGGLDLFIGSAGADTLYGGAAFVGGFTNYFGTVSYVGSAEGVSVDLTIYTGQVSSGDASGDIISAIPNITGSDFDDGLTGDYLANVLNGGFGNDILTGGSGADTLIGGGGKDTASYARSWSAVGVAVDLNLASAQVSTGDASGDILSGISNLTGSAYSDTLTGDANANTLIGGLGDDALYGGDGNDLLIGGGGADILVGGGGIDTVSYVGSIAGVTVNLGLTGAQVSAGDASGDTLTGFVNLTGSDFDDTLTGDASNNLFSGGVGADRIVGGGGVDTVSYASSANGVNIDLHKITAQVSAGDGTGDILSGITNLIGSSFADVLIGDYNDNLLIGGAGNDTLTGGGYQFVGDTVSYAASTAGVTVDLNLIGPQISDGDAAGDILTGISNIIGSDFSDVLTATSSNAAYDQTFYGGFGNDFLSTGGSQGIVTLYGGAGNDTLFVTAGTYGLYTLIGGAGADTIMGSGYDIASYASSSAGVTVDLNLLGAQVSAGDAAGDVLTGILTLVGSDFNDTLRLSTTYVFGGELIAGLGDDTLYGGAANEYFEGGAGADTMVGGGGQDRVRYRNSTAGVTIDLTITGAQMSGGEGAGDILIGISNLTGTNFADVLTGDANVNWLDGGSGDDLVYGGAGDDLLDGKAGNDTINGGLGDDSIDGGAGADTLIGGGGIDTVSYGGNEGVTVDLRIVGAQVSAGDASGDILSGISNLAGGFYADTLTGDANKNFLEGSYGDDILNGGLGNDLLSGGDGADTLIGGGGNDTVSYSGIYGSSPAGVTVDLNLTGAQVSAGEASGDILSGISNLTGSDYDDTLIGDANVNILNGGFGNDILIGGVGADELIGDTGTDTVSYAGSTAGVAVNLNLTTAQVSTGDASGDILVSIENLTGSGFNDTLTGDANANIFMGWTGNDSLTGGAGNDIYIYARGNGNDTISELGTSSGNDTLILSNLLPSSVRLLRSGNDVTLVILESSLGAGDGGSIVLISELSGSAQDGIENIQFQDGTVWTVSTILTLLTPPVVTIGLTSDTGASSTDLVTSNPALKGTADANATVTLTEGATSVTVVADAAGNWSYTPIGLANGVHNFVVSESNNVGLVGTASLTLTLDTAVSAPVLALAADTGLSGTDKITNNGNVNVTSLEAGATWAYSLNAGTTWTAGSGTSVALTGDGAKTIIVRQTDVAGNVSANSASLAFTLDTTVPAVTGLALAADTGSSATDKITNNGIVNVTGLEAGATWAYSLNAGTTWTAGSGTSVALTGDGAKAIIVRQTDVAGNVSANSTSLAFTLDTTIPAPILALAADTGLSGTDKITNNGIVNVTGLEPGATWAYSINAGTTWTAGSGTSVVLTGAGAKAIIVRQTDAAGNVSANSASLAFTLDTTAPAVTSLALAADTGSSATDKITNNAAVNVTGLEAGAIWAYSLNAGTTWTAGSGTSVALIGDGAKAIIVRQTDIAGNVSANSTSLAFTLDTVAQNLTAKLVTDSGSSATDSITNAKGLTGTAEANAVITVKEGTTTLGTATATAAGVWTFTPTTLTAGAHTFAVSETDRAGNIASTTLAITYDILAPTVAITTAATAVTYTNIQTIAGTGEAGTKVQLYDGTTSIGVLMTVDATGHWSEAVTLATTATSHSITAKDTDTAGNVGTSAAVVFTTDTIIQGGTLATVTGTTGNDRIYVNSPNKTVGGAAGADAFSFNIGISADTHAITGGAGIDTLDFALETTAMIANLATGTASGSQVGTITVNTVENVVGSSAADTITGDANVNTLTGGAGNDILTGGAGIDTFVYQPAFGFDTITDFVAGAGTTHDVLQLSLGTQFSSLAQVIAASTQVGANTVITIDATDTITLNNVTKTALVASNFVFA
jgi:Ca2+-binding RTX toxin-like protein